MNANNLKKPSYFMKLSTMVVLVLMTAFGPARGQDSLAILSPDNYLALVRQYHPVARQAGILVDGAQAQLRSARGFFDPSVYFTNQQKTFDGKNYYNYNHGVLKVPTWFGIELMAGLEDNGGQQTNNEVTLGQSSYAGLSIPLLKNLLMDRRRAALAQAKLMVNQSQAEQQLMINDLLFDAMAGYWNWVKEYQVYKVLSNAVAINEERYKLIRVTVEQGDRAGVDSTEALTQLLTFRAQQNDAYMKFLAAGFELSNYLWTEDGQPVVLPEFVVPPASVETVDPYSIPYQPLEDLLQTASTLHPKLQAYRYKLDALDIERRLKFQSLLPTLNVKYNALSKGYEFWKGWNATSMQNNYKFGVDVGMPLFLRQGRGDYKMAKLKIEATTYDQEMDRLGISNKVKKYFTEQVNLLQQLRLNEQALQAYQKVFEVEQMKFQIGESTLFLLNSRENKVLEARQKVAETRAKFFKSLYGVQWAAGILR